MRAAIAVFAALIAFALPLASDAALACAFNNGGNFPLTFVYDPVSGSASTATATISFTCNGIKNSGSAITITANGGVVGTLANRQMQQTIAPNDVLPYIASLSAGASPPIFGDGTGGTQIYSTTLFPASDGIAITFTVYGQIAAAISGGTGDVHAGSYQDGTASKGVTLTMTY